MIWKNRYTSLNLTNLKDSNLGGNVIKLIRLLPFNELNKKALMIFIYLIISLNRYEKAKNIFENSSLIIAEKVLFKTIFWFWEKLCILKYSW